MALKVADIHTWVQSATHGDELVYRKAGRPRDEKVFETLRKLSDGGIVFLFQRKHGFGGGWDHVARRTTPRAHDVLDWVSRATNLKGDFRPTLPVANPFREESDAYFSTPKGARS